MSRIGRLWTDSVAYVALILGAVTSIAGNVANVLRVRGDATDGLDLFLAGFFPGLVVLMVEVFVSGRWRGLSWPMQVLRWVGCAAVTIVAMRVSWVHLHALMVSRGQEADVAILGPLAIDFLAIMATALILAGRGQVPAMTVEDVLAKRREQEDAVAKMAGQRFGQAMAASLPTVLSSPPPPPPVRPVDMPSVADEAQHYLARLASELDTSTTPAHPIEVNPVSPAPRSNEIKPESVPDEAGQLILAWAMASTEARPTATERNTLLAAEFNVSTRTIRRWAKSLGVATGPERFFVDTAQD